MLDGAGAFERDLSDGLADYERAILAAWDRGDTDYDGIAREVGCSAYTARKVVERYDDRPDPDPRRSLQLVNARFLAAIDAARSRAAQAERRAMRREPQMISVGEIENMLKDKCEQVFWEIFPNARKDGHELCIGSLAGEPGQSLRMNIGNGSKRGWWKDFNGPGKGDVLILIREAMFAGDMKRAVAWAKSYLRIDDEDPGRLRQHRLEAKANAEKRAAAAEQERQKMIAGAVRRWHQARVLQPGDPVCRYLAGRGIDLIAIGRAPGSLRYHPGLVYGYKGPEVPAMVAMVTNLAGDHIATHRTWIAPDGSGKAGPELIGFDEKTGDPNDPKKVMGSPLGGHVSVWKGRHRCPLKDIPPGTDIYVSEGIEDGLTAAVADPSLRIICMIALSYLSALELPEQIGRLIILKQNDPPGSDAAKSLMRGVKAHREQGRRVFFVEPPQGTKDLNDLARGQA